MTEPKKKVELNQEFTILRSQTVTSSLGCTRYAPMDFAKLGVAMLRSPKAVAVNMQIMFAFVRLRNSLAAHEDLNPRQTKMERKYDGRFKTVFDAIRDLVTPPAPQKKRLLGFCSGVKR